jgi:hypothetical protein
MDPGQSGQPFSERPISLREYMDMRFEASERENALRAKAVDAALAQTNVRFESTNEWRTTYGDLVKDKLDHREHDTWQYIVT